VSAIAIAATVYASPYYALHQIKTALAERNAEALAAHVDFPALRASVKTQLEASMARSIEATAGSGNPLAALGQRVASAMLGKMVDTMVSPAGVVALVNKSAVSPQTDADADAPAEGARKKADYAAGYALRRARQGWRCAGRRAGPAAPWRVGLEAEFDRDCVGDGREVGQLQRHILRLACRCGRRWRTQQSDSQNRSAAMLQLKFSL